MRVPIYSGSVGMINNVPAHRLPYSAETGVAGLEDCLNVVVDRSGQIVSRRGTAIIEPGEFHSLYPGDEFGLVAKDRTTDCALYRVDVGENGSIVLVGLRSGLTKGARFDYCESVTGRIYYSNGYEHGVISETNRQSEAWTENEWFNDETSAQFEPVPPGECLCFGGGRILFSRGRELRFTEYGMPGIYDTAINGENFPSRITVIAAVTDGFFVSDERNIYFISGLDPNEWSVRPVTPYPATSKYHGEVDPLQFGFQTNAPSVLMGTVAGPVIGLPGGEIVNLIEKNLILPDKCKNDGAICLFDESLVIQTGVE